MKAKFKKCECCGEEVFDAYFDGVKQKAELLMFNEETEYGTYQRHGCHFTIK